MVVARVFGNDATVGFAGSQGNFQLNVFKPVMAHAVLESIRLIADASASFDEHCVSGLEPNTERIEANLASNLMLVTALNRHIGYDAAAAIAKDANATGSTLREAALRSGKLTEEQFDAWVVPMDMTHPSEGCASADAFPGGRTPRILGVLPPGNAGGGGRACGTTGCAAATGPRGGRARASRGPGRPARRRRGGAAR